MTCRCSLYPDDAPDALHIFQRIFTDISTPLIRIRRDVPRSDGRSVSSPSASWAASSEKRRRCHRQARLWEIQSVSLPRASMDKLGCFGCQAVKRQLIVWCGGRDGSEDKCDPDGAILSISRPAPTLQAGCINYIQCIIPSVHTELRILSPFVVPTGTAAIYLLGLTGLRQGPH